MQLIGHKSPLRCKIYNLADNGRKRESECELIEAWYYTSIMRQLCNDHQINTTN